jgi:hypothetical protein
MLRGRLVARSGLGNDAGYEVNEKAGEVAREKALNAASNVQTRAHMQ